MDVGEGVGSGAADGVETGSSIGVVSLGSSAAAMAPVGGWARKSVTVLAATIAIPTPNSA